MKHLKLNTNNDISYPVGNNMKTTLEIVADMASKIKKLYSIQPLNLFVRGSSGAILSGLIVSFLKRYDCRIIHIKKENEYSHGGTSFSLINPTAPNIILDDFISSGETVNSIYLALQKYNHTNIDVLCVSGTVRPDTLDFNPTYIISGSYKS